MRLTPDGHTPSSQKSAWEHFPLKGMAVWLSGVPWLTMECTLPRDRPASEHKRNLPLRNLPQAKNWKAEGWYPSSHLTCNHCTAVLLNVLCRTGPAWSAHGLRITNRRACLFFRSQSSLGSKLDRSHGLSLSPHIHATRIFSWSQGIHHAVTVNRSLLQS